MNAATAESRSKTTTTNPSGATARPGFGTVLADHMSVAHFKDGRWSEAQLTPTAPIPMHPAAHVLHYSSTCFEGFKAYRWRDGSVHVFRMDRHIERMRQSARLLHDARAGRRAARGDGDLGHRSLPRPGAGAAGRALPAAAAVRHDAEHRRGVDADERGEPDRAREPGLGLLLGRHEAAADLRRGQGQPHGRAPRRRKDRRQLRGRDGPDARGARRNTRSTRSCSARATRCRKPAPPTSC